MFLVLDLHKIVVDAMLKNLNIKFNSFIADFEKIPYDVMPAFVLNIVLVIMALLCVVCKV